jgi:hypothetical protein
MCLIAIGSNAIQPMTRIDVVRERARGSLLKLYEPFDFGSQIRVIATE